MFLHLSVILFTGRVDTPWADTPSQADTPGQTPPPQDVMLCLQSSLFCEFAICYYAD